MQVVLRYRPFAAFAALYGAVAVPAAAVTLAFAAVSPLQGALVGLGLGALSFVFAASRAAAGRGAGPLRFRGGTGIPRVLALRRRHVWHAAAFAGLATLWQSGVAFALEWLTGGAAVFVTPGLITALFAVQAVAAAVVIQHEACSLAAVRRAFAAARPGF